MAITIVPEHIRYAYPFRGACIYAIINQQNRKVYVGSAADFTRRISVHRGELVKGIHHSRYLQRAFNKCRDAFYVELIEEIPQPSKAVLLEREQFWMDFYKSSHPDFGYNLEPKAHTSLGYRHTAEAKQNMRRSQLGRKHSAESIAKMRIVQKIAKAKRLPMTDEQRKAHSEARKGHPCSEEEKQRKREWAKTHDTARMRAVLQFTLEGEFVKRFRTITAAARSVKTDRQGIRNVCIGKEKMERGFVWRYETLI